MEWKKENPDNEDDLAEKLQAAADDALESGPFKMTAEGVVTLLALERIDRGVNHIKWLLVLLAAIGAAALVILSRVT
ncbi:MAG: hypothetical protein LUE22_00765 [Oscillospiraceae bacterium]|nr:hypothetical protein [Oscillospiraceae bacterium]